MGVNVRLAGAAGQGVQTAADLLGKAVTRGGLWAYANIDAESRIRGGLNFSQVRIETESRHGVTNDVDVLVCLSRESLEAYGVDLADDSVVISAEDWGHQKALPFTLNALAEKAGNKMTAGVVAVAVVAALVGIDQKIVETLVTEQFEGRRNLIEVNIKAVAAGFHEASHCRARDRFRIEASGRSHGRLWLSGGQAVSLGAVAGGVSFIAAYPMSPSTSIITNLATWSAETGVVAEQAEDEISAINMVAGASFAGARAMTATSGGGLALMGEGLSLIGITEVPAVIVVAQRPGPATGMATRTAQGDLNFVRFAGHGYFPRVILAPKNIDDCFGLTARAFDLAERFQMPVFIMTDQLLQDSSATIDPPLTEGLANSRHYLTKDELEAMETYRRYQLTDSGVSPLAAPGQSTRVVMGDSHVHTEDGLYSEDPHNADRMARKRLNKEKSALEAAWPPDVEGNPGGNPLIVCWGSSYATAAEAVSILQQRGRPCALMNLRWLWPLRADVLRPAFEAASKIVVVENSVAGHLASILREVTLAPIEAVITKSDGRPFIVKELTERLEAEVKS